MQRGLDMESCLQTQINHEGGGGGGSEGLLEETWDCVKMSCAKRRKTLRQIR